MVALVPVPLGEKIPPAHAGHNSENPDGNNKNDKGEIHVLPPIDESRLWELFYSRKRSKSTIMGCFMSEGVS